MPTVFDSWYNQGLPYCGRRRSPSSRKRLFNHLHNQGLLLGTGFLYLNPVHLKQAFRPEASMQALAAAQQVQGEFMKSFIKIFLGVLFLAGAGRVMADDVRAGVVIVAPVHHRHHRRHYHHPVHAAVVIGVGGDHHDDHHDDHH
jgi:hypothetical protein